MKGTLKYFKSDPDVLNSIEGWSIQPHREKFSSVCYSLTEDSLVKTQNLDIEQEIIVSFELVTNCYVDSDGEHVHHGVLAKILSLNENI